MFSPEIFKKYGSNVSSLFLDSYESKSFRMFPDIIDSAFYSLNPLEMLFNPIYLE